MKRTRAQRSPDMSPGLINDGYPAEASNGIAHETSQDVSDVVVVGAGPAGLMLGANLTRFGVKANILDDRSDKTCTGRADGLQPKTLETLKQMRLLDPILKKGVKFYDMTFWNSDPATPLRRTGRECHYPSPSIIDVLEPFMLLGHQGMVEDVFLDDMKEYAMDVTRSSTFSDYNPKTGIKDSLTVSYEDTVAGTTRHLETRYLVGCDGAHSKVRRCMPDADMVGESKDVIWGVLDGEVETDFPDLWSKTIVHSEQFGTVLCIPRERNMTRLYIELVSTDEAEKVTKAVANQEFVEKRAREIFKPYALAWKTVEWFGLYQIGQRVANRFIDEGSRVFITGDASHTHSPKAGQGMNVSMHDSWNLCWKLNLAVRGLALPTLLPTYQAERRKIAQDLIDFDHEHAEAFSAGDAAALAANFAKNTRFISGVGAEYNANVLNQPLAVGITTGDCLPGRLLTPAKATRYIDHNPVDLQLDIPHLGQFRLYLLTATVQSVASCLNTLCAAFSAPDTFLGHLTAAADASYAAQPRPVAAFDDYARPERYVGAASQLFTFATVTRQPKASVENADLPPLLQASRWTFYLDDADAARADTRGMHVSDKWVGGVAEGECAVVCVRPDGYVGAVSRFGGDEAQGQAAVKWLEEYLGGFLRA